MALIGIVNELLFNMTKNNMGEWEVPSRNLFFFFRLTFINDMSPYEPSGVVTLVHIAIIKNHIGPHDYVTD